MRGREDPQVSMLAFVDLETRVPLDHPLRTIRRFADEALARLSPLFDALYAEDGRPAVDPARAAAEGQSADEPVLGAE